MCRCPGEFRFVQIPAGRVGILCKTRGRGSRLELTDALGERTNHSEKEHICHPKFVWYVERSSSADINPKSYHLISFKLVNPLIYIHFPNFESKIFLKTEVYVTVVCCVVTPLSSKHPSIMIKTQQRLLRCKLRK